MFIQRIGAVALGASLILAASAVPAAAASTSTVTVAGGNLTFKAAAGQKNTVVFTGPWEGLVLVDDRVPVKAGQGCSAYPGDKTKAVCAAGTKQIYAWTYDGTDSISNKAYLPMVAFGGTGADTLVGGQLNDSLYGGTGDDRSWGSFGDDTLHGEAGNDTIDGGFGKDVVYAGPGNDKLDGKADFDILYGGTGNDTIEGGVNGDRLYGQEGDDTLTDMNHIYEMSNELDILNGGPNATAKGDSCTAHPDDEFIACERS